MEAHGQGDVRRAVLDAALTVCATEGPDAVSMREVARRSGVSHQAPYHYFGDRAGIFAAITEEGFAALADLFRTVLATSPQPGPDSLRAYLRFAQSHPGHFRVMFRRDICGIATHDSTQHSADRAYDELLNLVERHTGYPADDPRAVEWATVLWSIAHGLSSLMLDGVLPAKVSQNLPGISIESHLDAVIEMFSAMTRPVGAEPTRGRQSK